MGSQREPLFLRSNKTQNKVINFKSITIYAMRLLFAALLLTAYIAQSQIKLNPDYTYIKDGKDIGYKKGLKHLQSGDYVADIQDENRTVTIRQSVQLEEGMAFPFEAVQDLDGKTWSSDDLYGKVVVVNFWFTGCRPCIMEMPELNEVVAQYEDQDVVFLAYANDIAPMVKTFLKKHPFEYVIIPGQMTATLEKGITMFPTHILVDKEGNISHMLTGYSEGIGDKISSKIAQMID
jgi:thiol-disulfide isomerase/thioredoxin